VCAVFNRRIAVTEQVVCEECIVAVDDEMLLLDQLCAGLPEALLPVRRGPANGARYVKPGSRPPVSIEALSLLGPGNRAGNELPPPSTLLREWATRWAIVRSISGFEREYIITGAGLQVLEVEGVPDLIAWMRDRLLWAAESAGDFAMFVRELRTCVRLVQRVSGWVVGAEERPIGWCPVVVGDDMCRAPLNASAWDDVILCPKCKSKFHRSDWPRLNQILRENGLVRR
jgi:hypothetical protein